MPSKDVATRVLVAEDDDDMRALLVQALRQHGYDVLEAENGMEVLGQLHLDTATTDKGSPADVIVTDVRMPGLTGMEILEGLRAARWRTSVIIISGYADDDIVAEAQRLGVSAILTKPFSLVDFMSKVDAAAKAHTTLQPPKDYNA